MQNNSTFFRNTDCEYFPCNDGVDKADFNCLFCYCPLYHRDSCGVRLENGIKDCSMCTFPHRAANYAAIIKELMKEWRL